MAKLNPGGRTLTENVYNEFGRLMTQTGGMLHPRDVVKAARDPKSPLHKLFTWDDREAAARYRISEARQLINSYEITYEEQNISVKALTSIEMDRAFGGGYRWTHDVLQRSDLREEMKKDALRVLEAARSKYQHVTELAEIWEAIEAAGGDQPRDSQGRFAS
jgi:hypothetical protein